MNASRNYIKTGIAAVPLVNQGTHICHFFKDKQELIDVMVSFLQTGLLGNEKCIWVTSDPLSSEEALVELKKKVNGVSERISKGQLLIIKHSAWYTDQGKCHFDNVLNAWIEAERLALKEGYKGLRAAGIMSWIKHEEWDNLVGYETAVDSVLNKHRILALCSYSLSNLETEEIIDMVSNHTMVVINRRGGLMAIGNSRQAKACIMRDSNLSYANIGDMLGVSRQRAHQILQGQKKSKILPNNMLNISEAASVLNVHINTLRRWSDQGILPVYRIGSRRDRRFKREDIDKLIFTRV